MKNAQLQEALARLPHRPPLRLVVAVEEHRAGRSLSCRVALPPPGDGMPVEAAMVEAVAQAVALLMDLEQGPLQPGEVPLLGSVSAKWRCLRRTSGIHRVRVAPLRLTSTALLAQGILSDSDGDLVEVLIAAARKTLPRDRQEGTP